MGDLNDIILAHFTAAGFTELDYATLNPDSWPAVDMVRHDGPPMPLPTGTQLFPLPARPHAVIKLASVS